MVNLSKSIFLSSKNVGKNLEERCGRILGIKASNSLGSYLGMPSMNSKSKDIMFFKVKDSVWRALQSWKEKLFLAGGKEILIKAVAQAIPVYTMSCFRIPSTMCKEINKICANFWWGSTDSKRKVHWKSWKALCKRKDMSGLGFRDLLSFNQAMLAKMSWRIIKNPNSLLVRSLRGRYFNDQPFLEASLGNNPSLTWRSIIWGRDLFLKGYRWQVGNGSYIVIDKDPWINREKSKTPSLTTDDLKGRSVSCLIDDRHRWNKGLIKEHFSWEDAIEILNIPLGVKSTKDEIVWSPDKKGKFTVRSAYHLAISWLSKEDASVSDPNRFKSVWKNLWKINSLPRAKICLWKVLLDILPTAPNLQKNGVDINPTCVLCRTKKESTSHIFWGCKVSKSLWNFFIPSSLSLFSVCRENWSSMDFWCWLTENLSDREIEDAVILVWSIWSIRNRTLIDSNKFRPEFDQIINQIARNFQNSKEEKSPYLPKVRDPRRESFWSQALWNPPPQNCWKLNYEASWNAKENKGGLGWTLRDFSGSLICAGSKVVQEQWPINILEANAMWEGLQFALSSW